MLPYDAFAAPEMVERVPRTGGDMVVGRRVDNETAAYRTAYRLGTTPLTNSVALLFGDRVQDLLSGYRVFSRRFVKSFAVFISGFEIEPEMTVHALSLRLPVDEIATTFKSRPEGSVSKLRTYTDGTKVIRAIFHFPSGREAASVFYGSFRNSTDNSAPPGLPGGYGIPADWSPAALSHRDSGNAYLTCGRTESGVCFHARHVTRGRKTLAILTSLSVPRWVGAERADSWYPPAPITEQVERPRVGDI
jgi:hypothetical protein